MKKIWIITAIAGMNSIASSTLYMDNGLATDDPGFMSVTQGDEGGGFVADLTVMNPDGNEAVDVLYDTGFVYRNGDTGDFTFMSSSAPVLQGDGSALSTGMFFGNNGNIDFSISTTVASKRLSHQLSLSSMAAFGDVTIENYLDQDVIGSGDDVSVIQGTGSSAQLFTFDEAADVGIAHSIDWTSSANLSFLSWTVYSYSDSVTSGGGRGTQSFSPDGVTTLDAYPNYLYSDGNPAYGPDDAVSAFAFKLDAAAMSASVSTGNTGVVSGIPEPATLGLVSLVAGGIFMI